MARARIADYRVKREIGRGDMAVVYLAKDRRLKRVVALKVFERWVSQNAGLRRALENEARAVAAIDHPHIVPIYDVGEADGLLYIAMDYISGSDLATADRDPWWFEPPPEAMDVAGALDAAHEHGVIHGNVRPSNILLDDDHFVYVTGFGLSWWSVFEGHPLIGELRSGGPRHVLDDWMREYAAGRRPQGLPSPDAVAYMAPELIAGRPVDGRSDQYSLACVVYEAISGRPPFQGYAEDVLWDHMHEPLPALTAVSEHPSTEVDAAMAKALAKSPEERYASCQEFVAALDMAWSDWRASWPHTALADDEDSPSPDGSVGATPPGPPFGDDDDEW